MFASCLQIALMSRQNAQRVVGLRLGREVVRGFGHRQGLPRQRSSHPRIARLVGGAAAVDVEVGQISRSPGPSIVVERRAVVAFSQFPAAPALVNLAQLVFRLT